MSVLKRMMAINNLSLTFWDYCDRFKTTASLIEYTKEKKIWSKFSSQRVETTEIGGWRWLYVRGMFTNRWKDAKEGERVLLVMNVMDDHLL